MLPVAFATREITVIKLPTFTRAFAVLMVAVALTTGGRVAAADPKALPPVVGRDFVPPPPPDFAAFYAERYTKGPTTTLKALARVAFDVSKYPEERKKLAGSKGFPNLGTEFEVLAPATGHPDVDAIPAWKKTYNCIAWSLGITDRWVWPGQSMIAFDELYAKHGYKRLTTRDTGLKAGYEKVVLYGKHEAVQLKGADGKAREEALFVATHAAKQEADGTWTSKLGGLALIKHPRPEAVSGEGYGDPIAVYARKKR